MDFLQDTTLLQRTKHDKDSIASKKNAAQYELRSTSSIASLVRLVRNPLQSVGNAVNGWRDGLTEDERKRKQSLADRTQLLYLRLRNATEYKDWETAATQLDDLEGNNAWKSVTESTEYDVALVEARLKQLDEARISCDVGRMLFLIRTSLTRGLGDMGNLKLYKHSHIGTKDLIERYITSALETLVALLDISARAGCDVPETKHILEQVISTRQAFGRSALLLSGGATFGMNHIGVLKTLWEAKLLPRIISGASAGSIVCAVICTRTDEEMPELLASFCHGDLAVFEEEGNEDGLLRKVARFLKIGALFDISHLTRVIKDLLGDMTFQEAYNRTRRILNICVSSASLYELPRILNYVTAPNVLIWSAVAASCSVPFVFSPASLLAKDPKNGAEVPWDPSPQRWIDGSVDNDLPMTRLAEMFNVNHFIVSQVNPHVVPFLAKEEDAITQESHQSSSTVSSGPPWLNGMANLAKGEAMHRLQIMAEMGVFPNTLGKVVSVLNQKYSGDITIFPEISFVDFPRIFSNPTPEFMVQAMLAGQRATWPKLSRIKNHCAIELALDEAVQKLRARVVFSPDQVEMRLGTQSRSSSKVLNGSRGKRRSRTRQASRDSAPPDTPATAYPNHFQIMPFIPRTNKHQKSSSTTTFRPYEESRTAPPDFSMHLPDITSSGAETSNRTTSGSDTDISSSASSDTASQLPSPTEQACLFPYASQPITPFGHRSRSIGSTEPVSPTTPRAEALSSAGNTPHCSTTHLAAALPMLTMTPKTVTASSPEAKYKRLFHQRFRSSRDDTPPAVIRSPQKEGMKRHLWGLKLDLPKTKDGVPWKKGRE